jgi:hypothetical protein
MSSQAEFQRVAIQERSAWVTQSRKTAATVVEMMTPEAIQDLEHQMGPRGVSPYKSLEEAREEIERTVEAIGKQVYRNLENYFLKAVERPY